MRSLQREKKEFKQKILKELKNFKNLKTDTNLYKMREELEDMIELNSQVKL